MKQCVFVIKENQQQCTEEIPDAHTYCRKHYVEVNSAKPNNNNDIKQIAKHLEHINWNLGTLVGILKKDPELIKKIEEAQNE